MANLLFNKSDLIGELSALVELSAEFVHCDSFRLENMSRDIEGLVAKRRGPFTLEIPKDHPFRTRASAGEFEPAPRKSSRRVYAKISGKWELEISSIYTKKASRKSQKDPAIGFSGLASTVVSIYDEKDNKLIVCWKMELGHGDAPGCFFHTFSSPDDTFPVPRHPNLFPTPMAAIGFTLGELFQTKWERALSSSLYSTNRWRGIQRERLLKLLAWQKKVVDDSSMSPWLALKRAKPSPDIFL